MTMAAARVAASHGAASQVIPQGSSDKEQQLLLLLIVAGIIIFIQHEKSGQPQQGTQYAALGVVGFGLLFLANFWPDGAFMFGLLFVLAILLNSPNGIPVVGGSSSSASSTDASSTATANKSNK